MSRRYDRPLHGYTTNYMFASMNMEHYMHFKPPYNVRYVSFMSATIDGWNYVEGFIQMKQPYDLVPPAIAFGDALLVARPTKTTASLADHIFKMRNNRPNSITFRSGDPAPESKYERHSKTASVFVYHDTKENTEGEYSQDIE